MKTSEDLKQILERIDHRGYPAYKDTRGVYQFGTYILGIDHVQGDPFAAPSRLHIQVAGRAVRIPKELYDSKHKKTAVADYLLRNFAKQLERHSFQAHGSGKSGIIQVTRCGKEVLERTACEIDEKTGDVTVRFEVGFPARGRTIQAGELVKILYQYLPACVEKALYYKNMDRNAVKQAAELSVDQEYIREQLKKEGLVAFVADGSILPRESGVSQRPMKDAVPFASPDSMRITMKLPYKGMLTGMGIRKGVTLIVGGGYHGKSTLLNLLAGFYRPQKGIIKLYGAPVELMDIQDMRNRIAVISQRPYLFQGTIEENVNIDGKASRDAVVEACRKSGALGFIEKLDHGFGQKIGQDGAKLSGGERQKIAVARALLKNADILLMDEATEGFDVESNEALRELLHSELKNKTIVFITHKYKELESVDKVYRLSKGILELVRS